MEEMSPDKLALNDKSSLVVNKIVGSLLFCVFGCLGFFYSVWGQNWNSAAWCLLLEIACAALLRITRCYVRSELHIKYSSGFLRFMKCVAAILTACSFSALVTYIVLGFIYKEEFVVRSHYAAAPVAFLAGFWYTILFFDCRKYEHMVE